MHFGLSLRWVRFRNECAAISAPRLVPHLTCKFSEKFLSLGEGLDSSAFRRDTSQRVPYGNRSQPSVYLYNVDKPKKKSLRGSGILPSPMKFISLARDFRKLSPALPFDLITRSLRIRL